MAAEFRELRNSIAFQYKIFSIGSQLETVDYSKPFLIQNFGFQELEFLQLAKKHRAVQILLGSLNRCPTQVVSV